MGEGMKKKVGNENPEDAFASLLLFNNKPFAPEF